ncbi:hypothetical protein WJX84_003432, partial [Apatococcus fuscideae]
MDHQAWQNVSKQLLSEANKGRLREGKLRKRAVALAQQAGLAGNKKAVKASFITYFQQATRAGTLVLDKDYVILGADLIPPTGDAATPPSKRRRVAPRSAFKQPKGSRPGPQPASQTAAVAPSDPQPSSMQQPTDKPAPRKQQNATAKPPKVKRKRAGASEGAQDPASGPGAGMHGDEDGAEAVQGARQAGPGSAAGDVDRDWRADKLRTDVKTGRYSAQEKEALRKAVQ